MSFATNYFSVHLIRVVSARAMPGNAVVVSVKGHYCDTEISLHVDNTEYAQRLAAAINDAVNGASEVTA